MNRFAVVVLSVAAFLTVGSVAQAGVVPRTGTWAGSATTNATLEDGTSVVATEQALFELRNRSIRNFEVQVMLFCYNRDTRASYDVYYGPIKRASLGRLAPGLDVTKRFTADDGSGRRANVSVRFDYRGSRAKLGLGVSWRGEIERCNGRATLSLSRGPLLPAPAP
ncbi:MAG: hypothetical protein ACKOFC_07220 [Solirubrobacterales bacterium]